MSKTKRSDDLKPMGHYHRSMTLLATHYRSVIFFNSVKFAINVLLHVELNSNFSLKISAFEKYGHRKSRARIELFITFGFVGWNIAKKTFSHIVTLGDLYGALGMRQYRVVTAQ